MGKQVKMERSKGKRGERGESSHRKYDEAKACTSPGMGMGMNQGGAAQGGAVLMRCLAALGS